VNPKGQLRKKKRIPIVGRERYEAVREMSEPAKKNKNKVIKGKTAGHLMGGKFFSNLKGREKRAGGGKFENRWGGTFRQLTG